MDLEFSISPKDLADQLYWAEEEEVIELVKRISTRWDDNNLDLELIKFFANELRRNGFTVNLQITQEEN
jgi:hypothetical protein